MSNLSYMEFSSYYDSYERLSEQQQHEALNNEEEGLLEEAGLSIASIPLTLAQDYLRRKSEQLQKSRHRAESVLKRIHIKEV